MTKLSVVIGCLLSKSLVLYVKLLAKILLKLFSIVNEIIEFTLVTDNRYIPTNRRVRITNIVTSIVGNCLGGWRPGQATMCLSNVILIFYFQPKPRRVKASLPPA